MAKFLGLTWAPFNIPWQRRLQTLTVLMVLILVHAPGFYLTIFLALLIGTRFWWLMLLYLVWIVYDADTSSRGSRMQQWLRNLSFWKTYASYFPAKLEKTVDLSPHKNYIFASHPHGILPFGLFISFTSDGTHFRQLFPGLRSYLCTLMMNFYMPFYREIIMMLGTVNVSKESITYLLTKNGKGNAVTIVVGGAQEALEAVPGRVTLVLKNRKGFAKMAIKCGADLVPVFSFGENELFEQVVPQEGSALRLLQLRSRKYLPFSMPLFYGRGVFNYTFGMMPHRTPIHTIVGKPIEVEQKSDPTREDVEKLHELYLERLTEVFETNKKRFGIEDDLHLTFV